MTKKFQSERRSPRYSDRERRERAIFMMTVIVALAVVAVALITARSKASLRNVRIAVHTP